MQVTHLVASDTNNKPVAHLHPMSHNSRSGAARKETSQKKQNKVNSNRKLLCGTSVFSRVMARGGPPPVIYLLLERVGPFAPAFLCLPTATHESSGHSCSRCGGKWVPDGRVFCVHVSVHVSLPHQRVLLLYKWPDSRPRGNAGRTTAGWRGRVGVAYCMQVRRSLSAEQLVGAGALSVSVHVVTCTRDLRLQGSWVAEIWVLSSNWKHFSSV